MKKIIFKSLNIASTVLIFGIVPIILFVFITSRSSAFFGIRSYTVMTGSMQPAISVGSMVFTSPATHYKIGDIITFKRANITITHRIVDIKNGKFITKGDANSAPDAQAVTQDDIIGKNSTVIPLLGRLSAFIKTPLGFGLLLALPTLLFVGYELWQIKREFEKIVEKKVLDRLTNQKLVHPFSL